MSKRSAEAAPRRSAGALAAACVLWLAAGLSGCGGVGHLLHSSGSGSKVPEQVRHDYAHALELMQNSDWSGAEAALKPLVASHPELPGPAVNLAIVYLHQNRPDDAGKILENTASRWPDFAPAQHQYGMLLETQGKFEAADAAFAQATAVDPAYALAYYDRAVLNELYLQRLPVALQNYEQYQRLQPKADEQVARWIADLHRRTGIPAPPPPAPQDAVPQPPAEAPPPAPAPAANPAPASAPPPDAAPTSAPPSP